MMTIMNSNDFSADPLESDLLRTFLAVARYGNVTRAAAALYRTQSAVSVQIKRLEEKLATRLFVRQARGMSLSDAGERLRESAERIVRDLDKTAQAFNGQAIDGTVCVGIPDDYGSDVLPGILSDFSRAHPAVEVYVRCEVGASFTDAIACGDLDLAVSARDSGSSEATDLFEEQTVWVCARSFQMNTGKSVPLALFDRSCWWRDCAIDALRKAGISYRVAYTSESVSGITAAISTGLAVGVLSRSTVQPSMKILDKKAGFPALPTTRLSLFQHSREHTPAVSAMVDAIRRGFAQFAVQQ